VLLLVTGTTRCNNKMKAARLIPSNRLPNQGPA
jgi:hypothetical protein